MAYTKTNWEDLPSTDTPITADNLQNMEDGIEEAHNLIDEIKDAEIYSTDEVKTNKKWIDNKPIYRKVITFNNSTAQETLIINTGISNIDKVVKLETIIEKDNQIRNLPYIQQTTSTNWVGGCYINKLVGELVIIGGAQITIIDNGIVIIEYTKTTD